ncbi:exodeoxyribonuclease III [Acanthopleuribacter pedis]|uniref:Exodeoxyribonuclease III n=1 Tax=Acanthopleuribacter pedis TaxID=442870 RepID=A0A8J7U3I0_9BACT|nr:exodeoxyribonuclease III [Acanthopleuribacter pedis]
MRVVSFNVNGIRARQHQLAALAESNPGIVGFQETKVVDAEFPVGNLTELGYQPQWFGQKGHYGVALMSRIPPRAVHKGFPGDDAKAQKRMIIGAYALADGRTLKVLNGYFPQGESRNHPEKFPNKQKFYADLTRYLKEHCDPSEPLLVIGDMNIARVDGDIGIGADNAKRWLRTGKASFLPEEREWMETLLAWGLTDTYRHLYPEVDDRFSWFDYRSKGFDREPKRGLRIDLILATAPMMDVLGDAGIDYALRGMEKPSDHCPVWADFEVALAGD